MSGVGDGMLAPGGDAPPDGETHLDVAGAGGFRVEQILSGHVTTPVEFIQAHDEWVVLVEGSAVVEVGSRRVELRPGSWLMLPSGTPHRLVRVEPGTSWVAVHGTRPHGVAG